jgi:hypothetical protein
MSIREFSRDWNAIKAECSLLRRARRRISAPAPCRVGILAAIPKHKECFMKSFLKVGLVLSMILVFGVGSVLAADQKRDRKRDGTCRSFTTTESSVFDLAANKQRDRKRDRSCQSLTPAQDDSLTLAADRKRDRKRDGSCRL